MLFTQFVSLQPGLNITVVGHGSMISIKKDLEERGISNSFDTWHGEF